MLDLVSRRYVWFAISLLVILPGLIFLLTPGLGLRTGVDFSGGTLWEFSVPQGSQNISSEAVNDLFRRVGGEIEPVARVNAPDERGQVVVEVRTTEVKSEDARRQQLATAMQDTFGAQLTRFEAVGETVSRESRFQAVIAVGAASIMILLYLTFAFRPRRTAGGVVAEQFGPPSIAYGVCAIIAMLHDVLVVLGVASILGVLIGLEVDALFLTALLTVLSFSVHDTIVVFDRVRENIQNRRTGQTFEQIVNLSVVQTLTRSINTQLTTFLTLTALLLFGGSTIRNFVLILLIGLLSGTYSSIFNAAQLLVVWQNGWRDDWRRALHRDPAKRVTV